MKSLIKLPLFFVLLSLFGTVAVRAQDNAPVSLAGSLLTLTNTSSTGTLLATGKYRLFTAPVGSNYYVLGNGGNGLTSGTYSYTHTATNTGTLTLNDTQTAATMTITFSNAIAGSAVLNNSAGAQGSSFTLTNFSTLNAFKVVVPSLTNHQFQAWLGGQAGFSYAVQVSTNLTTWSVLTNLPLTDVSTNFGEALATNRHFYRALVTGTQFAPANFTNVTLNLSITEGTAPLPTHGIYQFMAATNGSAYTIAAGPGVTNSTGTYTFTRTGSDTAQIAATDSLAGALKEKFYFTSPNTGYFFITNATGTQSGRFTLGFGPVEFLGNIKSVPDVARSGSLYFPATGAAASFSVTNAAGWIWTLSLPGDALLTPQTITMIPSASVDSSDALLTVSNGVQLEPDGTQFANGVTLSVKPPAPLGAHGSLMMAGDDGSAIYFVPTTNHAGTYSTVLYHFTSAGATDPSGAQVNTLQQAHLAATQAAYAQALADVKALERATTVPPEPPDDEPACDNASNTAGAAAAAAYARALFAHEQETTARLISAGLELYQLTGDPATVTAANAEILTLIETYGYRVVDSLFSRYSGDAKKFRSVTPVALSVGQQDLALGGSRGVEWEDQIKTWAVLARDYYFKQLTQGHDYSKFTVLIGIEQQLVAFGYVDDMESFNESLAKAMTFKLNIDFQLSTSSAQIEARGDVTLQTDSSTFTLGGSGSIPYLSGGAGPFVLIPGQSFSENIKVNNFQACQNPTCDLVLDQLGAASETYSTAAGPMSLAGFLRKSATTVFMPQKNADGAYAFTVALQNKNAQAVSQSVVGNGTSGGSVTITFTMTHTPQ